MRLTFAALSLAFMVSPVVAEEPGNLWEVTTSMEGGGMKMPGQTQQVAGHRHHQRGSHHVPLIHHLGSDPAEGHQGCCTT